MPSQAEGFNVTLQEVEGCDIALTSASEKLQWWKLQWWWNVEPEDFSHTAGVCQSDKNPWKWGIALHPGLACLQLFIST